MPGQQSSKLLFSKLKSETLSSRRGVTESMVTKCKLTSWVKCLEKKNDMTFIDLVHFEYDCTIATKLSQGTVLYI